MIGPVRLVVMSGPWNAGRDDEEHDRGEYFQGGDGKTRQSDGDGRWYAVGDDWARDDDPDEY